MEIIVLPGLKNLAGQPSTFTRCDWHRKHAGNWCLPRAALGHEASRALLSGQTFLCSVAIHAQGLPAQEILVLI